MFKFLASLQYEPSDEFFQEIICYLSLLKEELVNYFLQEAGCAYIADPLCADPVNLQVGTGEQEELTDIQSNEASKVEHKSYTRTQLLAEHGLFVPYTSPSSYSPAINFSYLTGRRAKILNAVECKIKKPKSSYCGLG